jgi:hypothetical protein
MEPTWSTAEGSLEDRQRTLRQSKRFLEQWVID